MRDNDNKEKLIIIHSPLKPQQRAAIDNRVHIVTVIPFNLIWGANERGFISIFNRPCLNVRLWPPVFLNRAHYVVMDRISTWGCSTWTTPPPELGPKTRRHNLLLALKQMTRCCSSVATPAEVKRANALIPADLRDLLTWLEVKLSRRSFCFYTGAPMEGGQIARKPRVNSKYTLKSPIFPVLRMLGC